MRARWIVLVATSVLAGLFTVVPTAAAAATEACPAAEVPANRFRDIAPGDVHRPAADCMAWWDIAKGVGGDRFDPGAPVTRPQLASFLARLVTRSGGSLPAAPPDAFPDDGGLVHSFSINRLADVGVVAGRRDGSFGVRVGLDRGQLASLLVRTYEERAGQRLADGPDAFTDDAGSVHEGAIDRAAAAGLLRGVGGGRFAPLAPVTRAQLASFLARTLELVVDGGVVAETPTARKAAADLRPFGDCDALLGTLKERALEIVGPFGMLGGGFPVGGDVVTEGESSDAAPAPAAGAPAGGGEGREGSSQTSPTTTVADSSSGGPSFSGTNNQEEGVDEADIVKTDGRTLFSLVDGRLRAVSASGATSREVGSLEVPTEGQVADSGELLLAGTRLLVLRTEYSSSSEDPGTGPRPALVQPDTEDVRAVVTTVDVADPAAMRVVSTLRVEGSVVSARLVDGAARVVLRSDGPRLPLVFATSQESMEAAAVRNREVVERSTIDQWLPDGAPLRCEQVSTPPEFSGFEVLSVLTIHPVTGVRPDATAAVLAGGDLVYASAERLYVATNGFGFGFDGSEGAVRTEVHGFDISSPTTTRYVGSGEVDGYPLDRFAFSEHEGFLRVATTTFGLTGSESQVAVLEEQAGRLVQVGAVGGLGRGEQIFAVRYVGDTGYVVTFRQTDPLFVVDLSDPRAPAVRGELDLLGFSAYLHPIGEDLLLGVGQDATAEGRALGTSLSVFDVSDPARPRRLSQATLEGGSSEVEFDARAFLYWQPTGLAVVPYSNFDRETGEPRFTGAVGFDIDGAGQIAELARVTHDDEPGDGDRFSGIRRSVVVGETVYTLSERGIEASRLLDLSRQGFTPFG